MPTTRACRYVEHLPHSVSRTRLIQTNMCSFSLCNTGLETKVSEFEFVHHPARKFQTPCLIRFVKGRRSPAKFCSYDDVVAWGGSGFVEMGTVLGGCILISKVF